MTTDIRRDGEPDLSSHSDYELEEPTYPATAGGRQDGLTGAAAAVDPIYSLVLSGVPGLVAYDNVSLRECRSLARRNLRHLAELRRMVDAAIVQSVAKAREQSGRYTWAYDYDTVTWEQIGEDLGITKQSAQGRFGSKK